ncbi:TPA: potassium-transporting ATPase subunit KdpA [Campylobacter jejuni]|uniref:potassium-transporting ATPase subunit KdpA n=1 Tax=Campylobacter jejuni TaxID=197 RepID=UPI000AE7436E|nr:potassium-transporting ATPase subunit KdpA [Campylobacter jejuni]KAJ9739648.1 potassium-transporting ATPase subunit KdpA [Campylobacter jejuni]KAJ9762709.1 potassium-transporting ATPase subunit KdpA [Campylobacter jejuni]KAJ9789487.1 potassium-transporting ATPase subunit KdpA [Campylobacter jejuni]KAJ9950447.1 potassium-transporting ATPase subunit KdpA [Campylobacter jejuni]KAJ9958235.1 potassium-transporting ATPase subunit KdpA [Campylobacter jejuni]
MGVVFFGTNSSMPFENPTLLTNFLQILSMMLIPSACVVAFGLMVYHRKEIQGFALMGKEGGGELFLVQWGLFLSFLCF